MKARFPNSHRNYDAVRFLDTEASRRKLLFDSAVGLGGIALAWLLQKDSQSSESSQPTSMELEPHFPARAKRIVQIFCGGGVSHIDTFDHKLELERLHGKSIDNKGENIGFFGQPGKIMKSPFEFQQHGQCGAWVSELFPNLSRCVDDIAFIHSMVAKSNNHTPATFQMNSGFTLNGFPSMGAWISYGLGTVNENLPTFVVLPDPAGLPAGGSINWTAGFLPASHQGVAFRTQSGREPIEDLQTPESISSASRSASLEALQALNRQYAERNLGDSSLVARVRSYELAARMQLTVPEATDLDEESEATLSEYGIDDSRSAGLGRNCLMARRLLERGVRFVQLFSGGAFGQPRNNWDAHESVIENHSKMAATLDKPVAALIQDLKRRGMLEDTLVVWCTEFGRGPATQGIDKPGRDHHPNAFTCFLAGAGIKPGFRYGASDEIGYFAVENPVTIHDFHATILHLLGLDHKRLTYYHNGIQRRLTDVHGSVVTELFN
ncbi:MAG: DUF1501 domain-containing protein [Pirellulaceae bacterium]|nr:DUF1501 domain-containing protein [Pirellulaceae bacterium]